MKTTICLAICAAMACLQISAGPSPTDTTLYDRLTVVNNEPGVPEGSIFAGFENNENVQLYNGNLLINHPSSPTFPWDGGMSIGLARVYNSKNAQKDKVNFGNDSPNGPGGGYKHGEDLFPGESWIGVGWTMHVGRVFRRAKNSQPNGPSWDNRLRDLYFEDALGTQYRIMSGKNYDSAHPNLKVVFNPVNSHWDCPPATGCCRQNCPPRAELCGECCESDCVEVFDNPTAHYLVTTEDGTQYRLEELISEQIALKAGDANGHSRGWISNHHRAGWYTTRITDVNGNAIVVDYWRNGAYPEAIKEIRPDVPSGSATWRIWTVRWDKTKTTDKNDADLAQYGGWNDVFDGMVKEVHATGFQGQASAEIVYKFVYATESATDYIRGAITVAVLREVTLPPIGGQVQGRIKYKYSQGPVDGLTEPGWGPVLDGVDYPLGGVSRYRYQVFTCGTKEPALCDCPSTTPRRCYGVAGRKIFPDGLNADGTGAGKPRSVWRWSRYFGPTAGDPLAACPSQVEPLISIQHSINKFEAIGPEGLKTRSKFHGHPCGALGDNANGGLPERSLRWVGSLKQEEVLDIDGTAVRTTDLPEYSDTGFDYFEHSPLKVIEMDKVVTFNDDTGACFGVGTSGAAKKMESHNRQRDNLSQWRLTYQRGDYLKTDRVSYVDYDQDADGTASYNLAPQCRRDKGIRSKYRYAFVEEGGKRYEVHFKFDGDVGTDTVNCGGRLRDILAHSDWGTATVTNPDTSTPPTAQFSNDASVYPRALRSQLSYNGQGNLTTIDYSGGDKDPSTGSRKSYQVGYTWQSGRAITMQVANLPYNSRNLGVDQAGNITSSTNPNGLTTSFNFDPLGRLTVIDPPGSVEQETRVVYPSLLETRVIRSTGSETEFNNSQSLDQLYSSEKYDGLGRVIERRKTALSSTPGESVLSIQIVRYDQRSREIFTSEWMYESEYTAATKVQWDDAGLDRDGDGTIDPYFVAGIPLKDGRPWGRTTFYGTPDTANSSNPLRATPDPLGRVRQVVLADGSTTEKSYCGPHEQETVKHVRTALSTTTPRGSSDFSDVTTRYYKDGLDRLVAVDTMPLAGQSGSAVGADALYSYDPRGNLSEVNLFRSNGFSSDPFTVWKSGPAPDGQKRSFTYNAVGRLIDSFQPEKGNEKNRLYDVWGNLLAWQDQLGLDRGYFFRNGFDAAGRLTSSQRRAGTLVGETVTGTGDRNLVQDAFATNLDGWEEGTLTGTTFQASSTLWGQAAYATLGCIPAPPGQTGGGMYFGSACGYGTAPLGPQLVRKTVANVGRDDALSFKYYRATRESQTLGSGNRDRLSVWVSLNATDTSGKRILFSQSEAQAVYPRWIKSPAIRPGDFFTESEWSKTETKSVTLFFVFEKGDTATSGLGAGVTIDDIYLGRKDVELLAEQSWDEAVCSAGSGGDACNLWPSETQDRANSQLTTVKSYQDGVLLTTKRYVFKGLNGRLSGVRSQVDWSGVARPDVASDWADLAYGLGYTDRGLIDLLATPYVVGVTEKRTYDYSYVRDLTVGIADVQRGLAFLKANGLAYDSAGMPTKCDFANDTTQITTRDAMHRPLSITSTWVSDPLPLFQTGSYQYDGAGNIFAIGGQDFVYDVVGRLTKAWMLPQASNRTSTVLHKLDYTFDWFGNIKSQQMASESGGPTPPAGLNFTLAYDSAANESSSSYFGKDNTNRITTAGFAFDGNGNSLRFRGQYQQAVGALWTPQNRMRAFIEGDPTAGASYPNENYQYDTAGYRLVKTDKTGKPLLSIRDEKGATLSEFIVDQGVSNPRLDKDFVYANGQLLVERTVSPAEPTMQTHSVLKSGNAYNFKLTSQTGFASYAVDISANSGWRRQVGDLHPDGQNVIALDESNFSPGETNFVRVRIESPEASGYSAPVSLTYDASVSGSSANQIRSFTVSRDGTNIIVRWALGQANGKQTKLYFKRADGTATYLLTPAALSSALTSFTLDSQALASPCGNFWGTQFNAGVETAAGPSTDLGSSRAGEQGTQDGCGGLPPGPGQGIRFTNRYVHVDHIGSLRLVRPDSGAMEPDREVRSDYYPFGDTMGSSVADELGQFAGHEHDAGSGFDYMRARYFLAAQARFVSVDQVGDGKRQDPATWNNYGYVGSSPIGRVDPTGNSLVKIFKVVLKTIKGLKGEAKTVGVVRKARLTEKQAIAARKAGKNVQVLAKGSQKEAKAAAKKIEAKAHPDKPQMHDGKDQHAKSGNQPHWQSQGVRGHTFYKIMSAGSVTTWFGSNMATEVIDFFNPLSAPKDVIDIGSELLGGGDGGEEEESAGDDQAQEVTAPQD